jgi:PKD repeat protein
METAKPAKFSAQTAANGVPAVSYHWDFGDGTSADGASITHAFTHTGSFTVHLKAEGIEGVPFEKSFPVSVAGTIDTKFRPDLYQRYSEEH